MKRGLSFLFLLVSVIFLIEFASASPADLNSDNKVNATDIQLIIRWILGLDQSNPATDMDGNGQVNIFDLVNASRLFGKIYGSDSTAPTIISSSPSANLSAGATSTILFAKTDERATCKYLNSSSGNYSVNMTTFTRTGGVSHSTTLAGLANGTLYNYYIQCQDEAGNLNSTNYNISFGVNSGSDEPFYNPSSQTLLLSDNFNSYNNFTDVIAGGWLGKDRGTAQDYGAYDLGADPNHTGANQVITGINGTGKAIRLEYFGVPTCGSGQECPAWGRTTSLDGIAGKVGHTIYVSYWFRITAGGGQTLDFFNGSFTPIVQVKWLELWATGGDRAQFHTSYSFCHNDIPKVGASGGGTMWGFTGKGATNSQCVAGQTRPPWAYSGQGDWHRVTHKYVTKSGTSATDAVAQMWYDGTKIISVSAADVNVTVPNSSVGGVWSVDGDLSNFFVDNAVNHLTLGSVMTGVPLWPFTIDWDNMTVWRD